jgi:protease-4
VNGLKLLAVALLLPGCRVTTESGLTVRDTVAAKVQAELTTVGDPGPLLQVPVPPCDGPCAAKVAVLDVDGVLFNINYTGPYSLGENPVATFREKLDAAAGDPAVKAVVLRINSPGGGVAACDLLRHDLLEFRRCTGKPVVAMLLDLGTGGAYYLATAADEIVALPATVVGGIGVVINLYYGSSSEQINVFDQSIRSGASVDMGSLTRKMTDEEKARFEAMAKQYHDQFKQAVLESRPHVRPDAPAFDGRVMTAAQAMAEGLIDATGYPADAVAAACRRAGLAKAQAVMYRRPNDPVRSLYAVSPNRPLHPTMIPLSVPGLDRAKLPLFLYMWQTDPSLVRLTGL